MKFKHLLFIVAASVSTSASISVDVTGRPHTSFITANISQLCFYTPQTNSNQLTKEDLNDTSVLLSAMPDVENIIQIKCMNSCDYFNHTEMHFSVVKRNLFFTDNLSDPWALAYLGLC